MNNEPADDDVYIEQTSETMDGVREYCEHMEVKLVVFSDKTGEYGPTDLRPVIDALNEAGYNGTRVDLLDLLKWIKLKHPEYLEQI